MHLLRMHCVRAAATAVRTPAACSTSSRSAASAAACDALLAARAFSAAQQQHRRPRRHVGVHYRSSSDQLAAQQQSLRITPDTSIDAAVAAAIAAVGRTPGPAEQQLVERLQQNLYRTAGELAALSQEEVDILQVPVKLWALMRDQLDASAGAGAEAAVAAPPAAAGAAPQQPQQRQSMPAAAGDTASAAGDTASATAQAAAGRPPLPADIMQRRLPPVQTRRRPAAASGDADAAGGGGVVAQPLRVRSTPLRDSQPYGLRERDLMPALQQELARLEHFCTARWFGQLAEPMLPVTYRTVTRHYVMLMLGYLHTVRGAPLAQLGLRSLLPSAGREGVSVLMEYQHWRQQQRGTAASTATVPIKAMTHVARFLYHDQCESPSATGKRPYADLEVVQELAAMQRAATKAAAHADAVSEEGTKWLQWEDYLALVAALRAECAGLTTDGRPRSRRQVAASLQRYLVAAILSVVPDRQRTLRELEVGRTLVQREADGAWVIKHGAADYKTGKQYGDRPPLVLAPFIYPELEAFIGTWRAELAPATPRLFVRPGTGQPLTESDVYYNFRSAALRLTGQATNPHLVRDMIVTHAKVQRRTAGQMEALALYMGHSVAMQRASYDRRSKAQKVTPAVKLLQGLWGGGGSGSGGGGGGGKASR